jgi:hypothetical protein
VSVDLAVPELVQESAEYWAENHARYWKSRAIVLAHVGSHGPIRLADGRLLGYQPDGQSWDGDGVAQIMPALIKNAEATFSGGKEQIERLLSIALEELPDVNYAVKLTVDATAANAVVRAGGEAADRLLPFRVAKNKLGVR